MVRQALDVYDDYPPEMKSYLRHNGWHFNKKAFEYAKNLMERKNTSTNKVEKVDCWTKEEVDDLMKREGIVLENNVGYDYVYVAAMCKADFYKSSIPDDSHAAKFVKDVVDDDDGADGMIMREWYAKMVSKGIPVDWSEIM